MTLSEDIVKKLRPGFTFLFPNLLSTSKHRSSTFPGNVRLEIDLDKAKSMTFALHIASLSAYPGKDEVLFYPYSGFEVLGTTEVAGQVTIQLRPYDTLLIEAHDTGMSHRERVRAARERAAEIKGKGKGKIAFATPKSEVEGKTVVKGKGTGKGKVADSVKETVVEVPSHAIASVDSTLDMLESAIELQQSMSATTSIEEATFSIVQTGVDSHGSEETSVNILEP